MAKKSRLRYVCEWCQKRFKTPQAKWGHIPHCATRKLSLQPTTQAQAEAEATHGSLKGKDHESRRPGPDSQENKLLLLDTHEDIKQLFQVLELILVSVQFLFQAAFAKVSGNITPQEWGRLYAGVDSVERDFELMIGPLRLDRTLLFGIYHRLSAIRDAWLQYREHDLIQDAQRTLACEGTSNPESMIEEDRARLDDVMAKVKRLLVAAR